MWRNDLKRLKEDMETNDESSLSTVKNSICALGDFV